MSPRICQVHADLVWLHLGYQHQLRHLTTRTDLKAAAALLAEDTSVRATVTRGRLARMEDLTRQIDELRNQIHALVAASGSSPTQIYDHRHHARTAAAQGRAGDAPGSRRPARLHRLPPGTMAQDWSTIPLERVNREVKRGTEVVGVFPNPPALLRLAGAVLVEIHDEWAVASERRYLFREQHETHH